MLLLLLLRGLGLSWSLLRLPLLLARFLLRARRASLHPDVALGGIPGSRERGPTERKKKQEKEGEVNARARGQ